jgi:RimJ/RimL family protein N-acetyltransferase
MAVKTTGTDWFLETERLLLRRVALDDAGFMLSIWNDPAFIRHVGDRGIRSIEEAEAALQEGALKLYEEFGYGPYCMSLKEDGTLVGICGLFRRDNLDDLVARDWQARPRKRFSCMRVMIWGSSI